MVITMLQQCAMSDDDIRRTMAMPDMIEMREIRNEREYIEEAGRILLPQAC